MKYVLSILIALGITVGVATKVSATAHTSQYWICSTPSLKAVYQYPTGSYWVNQTNTYPAYYTAHNAYYLAKYGC